VKLQTAGHTLEILDFVLELFEKMYYHPWLLHFRKGLFKLIEANEKWAGAFTNRIRREATHEASQLMVSFLEISTLPSQSWPLPVLLI
jgi:hypothetical protein